MLPAPAVPRSGKGFRSRARWLLFCEQGDVGRSPASTEHNACQRPRINTTLKCFPLRPLSFHKHYNMSNIEGIDSRLPYRIGSQKLAVLPVETRIPPEPLNTYMPNFDYHLTNSKGILAKYDIPFHGHVFAHRGNQGVDAADRYLTLVFISWYEPGCRDRWIKAVKEIRTAFVQAGISWAIELIDARALNHSLHTSPILSTDRGLIEGWRKVLPAVLAMIENQSWVAIDVLYREFPSAKMPPPTGAVFLVEGDKNKDSPSREMRPTVIISARDANDDAWWDSTLPALNQLLQSNELKVDIVLLFAQGIGFTTTGPTIPGGCTEPDHVVREDFYNYFISMGTSCAVSGSIKSGTLGGRVKLQKESSVLELGLTNCHVLMDASAAQGSMSKPFPPDLRQLHGTVVSPSDRDHEVVVQGIKAVLNMAQSKHQDFAQKLEYLAENDPAWQRVSNDTEAALHKRMTLEKQLKTAETSSRHLGRTYATSGFRACENPRYSLEEYKDWALDWCLIETDQSRSISNTLNYVPTTAHEVANQTEISQYCTISPTKNYKVLKRGRTTGWTNGTMSAIDSIICLRDRRLPELKLPTNQKVEFEGRFGGKPVFVHTVLGTEKSPMFLQPGDSGSLVLLDEASNIPGAPIVGLGFSGNQGTLASYVIPMDLIVEDIEQVTGGKVLEPQNAGKVEV